MLGERDNHPLANPFSLEAQIPVRGVVLSGGLSRACTGSPVIRDLQGMQGVLITPHGCEHCSWWLFVNCRSYSPGTY